MTKQKRIWRRIFLCALMIWVLPLYGQAAQAAAPALLRVDVGQVVSGKFESIVTLSVAENTKQLTATISHTQGEQLKTAGTLYISAVERGGLDVAYEYTGTGAGTAFYSYPAAGHQENVLTGISLVQNGSKLSFSLKLSQVSNTATHEITGQPVQYAGSIEILPQSTSTAIQSVDVVDAVRTSVNNGQKTITVVMPYGYFSQHRNGTENPCGIPDAGNVTVKPAESGAQPSVPFYQTKDAVPQGSTGKIGVTGTMYSETDVVQGKPGTAYALSFQEAVPFSAFSLSGQSGTGVIDHTQKTIKVTMGNDVQRDADGKLRCKVTFQNPVESTVYLQDSTGSNIVMKSGESYDVGHSSPILLTVVDGRSGLQGSNYQTRYTLHVEMKKSNGKELASFAVGGDLRSLSVGKRAGSTLTVETGAFVNVEQGYLRVVVSRGAGVELPQLTGFQDYEKAKLAGKVRVSSHPTDANYDVVDFPAVDLSLAAGKTGTVLRIRDEARSSVDNYTLSVKKAAAAPAKPAILSMQLTTPQGVYQGSVDPAGTITFRVPYATTDKALDGWGLSYEATVGTQVGYYKKGSLRTGLNAAPLSLKGFVGEGLVIPSAEASKAGRQTTKLYAAAVNTAGGGIDSATLKDYEVVITFEEGGTGKALKAMSFSTQKDRRKIENNQHNQYHSLYEATIAGGVIQATLSSADYERADALYASFRLDEGAKAYFYDGTGYMRMIGIHEGDPAVEGDLAKIKPIDATGTKTKGSKAIVVINEKGNRPLSDTPLASEVAAVAAADKTVYTLQITGKEKGSGAVLKKFSLVTNRTGGTSAAQITQDKICLTLKHSFASGQMRLYPVFEVSEGATLSAKVNGKKYTFVSGGLVDESGAFLQSDENVYLTFAGKQGRINMQAVDFLQVTSEDGKTQMSYELVVTDVAPVETEAKVAELTAGGWFSTLTKQEIVVYAPQGASYENLPLHIATSPMAQVTYLGNEVVNGTTKVTLSETVPILLTVTSEDGKTVVQYQVRVKTQTKAFADISAGGWYYNAVMEAAELEIVNGVTATDFIPDANVKRGDFALMLARMLGADLSKKSTSKFSDVKDNAYYASAVAFVEKRGYVLGYEDGTFRPEIPIKRQEAAAILSRVMALKTTTEPETKFADHEEIPVWAQGDVYACQAAGVLLGDENHAFLPGNFITRAQAAAVVVRTRRSLN